MDKLFRRTAVVALLIAFLLASSLAVDFLHPRLKDKETVLHTVIMVPPIVEMAKHGVKGTEGMGAEAMKATDALNVEVVAALQKRGLSVESPFTEEALKDNEELRSAMADAQKRFDEVTEQLYKHEKDVKKGRFSLGDSVAVLNTKGDADALVFVRSHGEEMTKGKGFMTGGLIGMAASGTPTYRSRLALVDAKNGDILFFSDYISSNLPRAKVFDKSLEKVPVGK
jgi:hypothetical protein